MISTVKGKIEEISPTHVILECSGIGYHIHISLNTFTSIADHREVKLYTSFIVREGGEQLLYGFWTKDERALFDMLISVSGVGPTAARLILSSLEPIAVKDALASGNVQLFQRIKGIGPKTAQRIIIDLKDKAIKESSGDALTGKLLNTDSTKRMEAISALLSLGFNRLQIDKVFQANSTVIDQAGSVEEILKFSLKKLA